MRNSSRKEALQKRIEFLERKQKSDLNALKFQLEDTFESLKPIHLLKNFVEDLFVKSTKTRVSILKTITNSVASLLIKKIIIGKTNSFTEKLLANIIQFSSYKILNKYINN